MESVESLKNELKLLDNFMGRRNQSGIKKSMMKILQNPVRLNFSFQVVVSRSKIVKELKQSLSHLVTSYQNDQISVDLVTRSIVLAKSLNASIQIGVLTPVCILCHSACDPYSKKVPCCGYYAHIPCLEQIVGQNNKYACPKCSTLNTFSADVKCKNCQKTSAPENTMVSACRHIVCAECVASAQPLVPSPLCFCCPYKLPPILPFKLTDVNVI